MNIAINKYILIALTISAIIFSTSSCTDKEGAWDDIIELSQKEATYAAAGDSLTFTTKGDWWWISDISLDEVYIDFEETDTTADAFEIAGDHFKVIRINKTELLIIMTENTSTMSRKLRVGIQAGNYFDSIKITQLGS